VIGQIDPDSQPAAPGAALDASLGMPRILTDLADGSLNEEEAATVAAWLVTVSDEEPPAWVVNRAMHIAKPASVRAKAG
jgi:hypothetical protein